jgi:hypothetical protein
MAQTGETSQGYITRLNGHVGYRLQVILGEYFGRVDGGMIYPERAYRAGP